jgi:hypothetical protein
MIAFQEMRLAGRLASETAPREGNGRFTLDGDAALEAHLASACADLLAGVRGLIPPERLEAVLLGGGYGRGEGGVLRTAHGDRPYNDLEFYVCVRGNRFLGEHRHALPLQVLGEILTPRAGVEVEFKITSLDVMRRAHVDMFSYDLVMGHRRLWGATDCLARLGHHRDASAIPAWEITRLLMNRCAGLLLARERLGRTDFTPDDADFVERNLAKAELALGDAVLAAHGRYHWSCLERRRRLRHFDPAHPPPWLDDVVHRHGRSVFFKLHPSRGGTPRESLRIRHAAVTSLAGSVWLWHESRRLGHAFASMDDYAENAPDLCPHTRPLRNLLVNLRHGGPRSLLSSGRMLHPRDTVLRLLARLLWEQPRDDDAFPAEVAAFETLRRRVS